MAVAGLEGLVNRGKALGMAGEVAVACGCPWDPQYLRQGLEASSELRGACGSDSQPSWDLSGTKLR